MNSFVSTSLLTLWLPFLALSACTAALDPSAGSGDQETGALDPSAGSGDLETGTPALLAMPGSLQLASTHLYSITAEGLVVHALDADGLLDDAVSTEVADVKGRFLMYSSPYLCVLSSSGLELDTYDVSIPTAPVLASSLTLGQVAERGLVSGTLLLLAHAESDKVGIYSLATASAPTWVKDLSDHLDEPLDMIHFHGRDQLFVLNRGSNKISIFALNPASAAAAAYASEYSLAGAAGLSGPTRMRNEDSNVWVSFDGDVGGVAYLELFTGKVIGQFTGETVADFVFDRNRLFFMTSDAPSIGVLDTFDPAQASIEKWMLVPRSTTYSLSHLVFSGGKAFYADGTQVASVDLSDETEGSSAWRALAAGSGASASGISPAQVTYHDDVLFVGNSANRGVQAYDLSDLSAPALLSEHAVAGTVIGVETLGNHLVTLTAAGVLRVYDRSGVADLTNALLGQLTLSVTSDLTDLKLHGTRAYVAVAGASDQLLVVSLATPAAPAELAPITLGDNPTHLAIKDDTLYVLERTPKKIAALDLTQCSLAVSARVDVSSQAIGGTHSMTVGGDHLYVGLWGGNWGWVRIFCDGRILIDSARLLSEAVSGSIASG